MARTAKQRAPLLRILVILVVVAYLAAVTFYSRPKLHTDNQEEQLASGNLGIETQPVVKKVAHVPATKPPDVAMPSPREEVPLPKPAAIAVAAPSLEPQSGTIAENAASARSRSVSITSSVPASPKQETKQETFPKIAARAVADVYTGRPLAETPPIIVGGTDGSGTRGAVALLMSLEVSAFYS